MPSRSRSWPRAEPGAGCLDSVDPHRVRSGRHQIGFNDLKAIEKRDFLVAVAGSPVKGPDSREAYEVQRLVELAYRSAREKRWLAVK